MKKIDGATLEGALTDYLVELGTPRQTASLVAASLVLADRTGHASHGVQRLPEYHQKVNQGIIQVSAGYDLWRNGSFGTINGNWGWGQAVARKATELAITLASETGVAIVSTSQCNHIGRLGEYAEILGKSGLMALIMVNGEPNAAPHGSAERLLGTNPLAMATPTSDEPVVHDIATTVSAEGKLRIALREGTETGEDCIVRPDGSHSSDPKDYYDGGALLPFGGHKGSGIMTLIDLIAGPVSGHSALVPEYEHGNGMLIIAFDPKRFPGFSSAEIDVAVSRLRNSRSATSHGVLAPGDIEQQNREHSKNALISISGQVEILLGPFFGTAV